jgi:hypothetical protein
VFGSVATYRMVEKKEKHTNQLENTQAKESKEICMLLLDLAKFLLFIYFSNNFIFVYSFIYLFRF